MNKEPIGLYIFRYLIGLGLFAFMAMLYWSTVLIEDRIQEVQTTLNQLEEDHYQLSTEGRELKDEIVALFREEQRERQAFLERLMVLGVTEKPFQSSDKPIERKSNHTHSQVDEIFPNILSVDPFYEKTLPQMLGEGFEPKGMRRGAIVGRPDNLHPFSNWSHISSWNSLCNVSLSAMHFGKYETMAPDMALKIEERPFGDKGRTEYWVHLRDNVFWAPLDPAHFPDDVELSPHFLRKHKVTAHDYKFYLDAIMNTWVEQSGAVSLRNYLGDIEELRVIDDLTFVVRWKANEVKEEDGTTKLKVKYIAKQWTGQLSPLASFVYKYFADGTKIVEDDSDPKTYRNNSVWAQNFNQHWAKNVIVSCGAWLFDGMSERQINFRRNPDFYQPLAALSGRMEVYFKESNDAIWQDFKSGKLDVYGLPPDKLTEYEEFLDSEMYAEQKQQPGMKVNRLDFVGRSYSYLGWNEARPFFSNKNIRQALSMAIDRKRIIDQNLNGLGIEINGPFFVYSKAYDPSIQPWPFNPLRAKRLLEKEGWFDRDGDGTIEKEINGKVTPFRFSLTYYVKNPTAQAIGEYVASAMKEIGVKVDLNGVDIADLSGVFDDKDFESLLLAWSLGTPPEEPRQLWHSSGAKEKGSSNAIGFANKEADKIIDLLQYEYDKEKRIELYHQFDAIIHEEAPYTFLYTPKSIMLYRDYLQNVFIPADRQDLIPGADVAEPQGSIFWIKSVK